MTTLISNLQLNHILHISHTQGVPWSYLEHPLCCPKLTIPFQNKTSKNYKGREKS